MFRRVAIFAASFALVLVAGVAFAQMGGLPTSTGAGVLSGFFDDLFGGDDGAVDDVEAPREEPTDEPAEEPKEEPADKPHEEPADKPHEEPAEEPKEEPAEEPKEEADTTPPLLEIHYPQNEQHFTEKTIPFEGITEPGAVVKAGKYQAEVDAEGYWRIVLVLSDGWNRATLTATDAAGNVSDASVKVYYDAPEEPKVHEFSAHQKYGPVRTEPWDKFYGTGQPGSKITATSPYGAASTTVGEGGEWWLKVWFEGAPVGHDFAVVLADSRGHSKSFGFMLVEKEHHFTAHQKYGSCGEDPPYDVFYGTATPGHEIAVVSEYGSGATVAGEGGGWELRVNFPESPVGKTFAVKVINRHTGATKIFEFTRTA